MAGRRRQAARSGPRPRAWRCVGRRTATLQHPEQRSARGGAGCGAGLVRRLLAQAERPQLSQQLLLPHGSLGGGCRSHWEGDRAPKA